MRLLFDHNLSPTLVRRLADLFPDSNHVFLLDLHTADDVVIWEHARASGFAIVTKDSDFSDRSLLLGHPPKVIRLHLGNCATSAVRGCCETTTPSLPPSSGSQNEAVCICHPQRGISNAHAQVG